MNLNKNDLKNNKSYKYISNAITFISLNFGYHNIVINAMALNYFTKKFDGTFYFMNNLYSNLIFYTGFLLGNIIIFLFHILIDKNKIKNKILKLDQKKFFIYSIILINLLKLGYLSNNLIVFFIFRFLNGLFYGYIKSNLQFLINSFIPYEQFRIKAIYLNHLYKNFGQFLGYLFFIFSLININLPIFIFSFIDIIYIFILINMKLENPFYLYSILKKKKIVNKKNFNVFNQTEEEKIVNNNILFNYFKYYFKEEKVWEHYKNFKNYKKKREKFNTYNINEIISIVMIFSLFNLILNFTGKNSFLLFSNEFIESLNINFFKSKELESVLFQFINLIFVVYSYKEYFNKKKNHSFWTLFFGLGFLILLLFIILKSLEHGYQNIITISYILMIIDFSLLFENYFALFIVIKFKFKYFTQLTAFLNWLFLSISFVIIKNNLNVINISNMFNIFIKVSSLSLIFILFYTVFITYKNNSKFKKLI